MISQKKSGFDLIHTFAHGLYLGGITTAKNADFLKEQGVTAVLSLLTSKEIKIHKLELRYQHAHIQHKHLELEDLPEQAQKFKKMLEQGRAWVMRQLQRGNVFVHCLQGISRSGSMVSYILMKELKISVEESIGLVRERRCIVQPNPGFRKMLHKIYQSEL